MTGTEAFGPHSGPSQRADDTIVAVATPSGHGAIGLVRISGPGTLRLLGRFCRSVHEPTQSGEQLTVHLTRHPRRAVLCRLVDVQGHALDEGLVVFFRGPRSYTGQDAAEISLHGNPHLLRAFVLGVLESGLARSAEGGEFTRRAFLAGKLDLTQAEGVRRLIEARSEYEARAGRRLVAGALSRLVSRLRSGLVGLKAETEAEVDFSTEDLTFASMEERRARLDRLVELIDEINERGRAAGRVVSGLQMALAGVPNAGKSSLLNQIVGWERAIVSEVPGTTRDFLTEELHIGGSVVRIMDTAGLRHTEEMIEKEGVRRSRREIEKSHIILHVIDGSRPAYPELDEFCGRPEVINIINKCDILHSAAWSAVVGEAGPPGPAPDPQGPRESEVAPVVRVSCRTGEGLDELRERIAKRVRASYPTGDPILLEDRHREHLLRVRGALLRVRELWDEAAPQEIVAIELDAALEEIGRISGGVTTEEILGRIFSEFCVGK